MIIIVSKPQTNVSFHFNHFKQVEGCTPVRVCKKIVVNKNTHQSINYDEKLIKLNKDVLQMQHLLFDVQNELKKINDYIRLLKEYMHDIRIIRFLSDTGN